MNIVSLIQSTKNNLGNPSRALSLAAVSYIPSVISQRESLRRVITATALPLAFFAAGTIQAGSSTWNGPTLYTPDFTGPDITHPDWNDPAYWNGNIIPNGVGDVATFNTLTGRLNFRITNFANGAATPGGATTITLGGLTHTGVGRLDSRPYGPTSTIIWDNGGSNAVLNSSSTDEYLLAHNHTLNSSLVITKGGGQTRLQQLISGPGGIIMSGAHQLILGETGTTNTFTGGVTFLNTSFVDVRRPNSTGTGAFTFMNTSTANSNVTTRNNWDTALPNDFVVNAGGFGKIEEEGGDATRTFSGEVKGGGTFRLQAKDSLWDFANTNSFSGALQVVGDGSANVLYGVEGGFNSAATINLSSAATFHIASANVIGDNATVTLDATSYFVVATGLNEQIGSGRLTVNGSVIADGTYNNTASWIDGPGTITVIPEPTAFSLLALAGVALIKRRRR